VKRKTFSLARSFGVLIYDGGGGEAEKKGKSASAQNVYTRKEKKSLLHDGAHCMNNEGTILVVCVCISVQT
jgi:hypothetical protein